MSLVGLIWLIIKLLVLGAAYYGIEWLINFLGVSVPVIMMKILAAILVLIGLAMILSFIGVV